MTIISPDEGGRRSVSASIRANGRMNVLTGRRESFWFHLSCALNAILGGDPRMTFSARSHRARLVARHPLARAIWRSVAGGVDLGCALLYGESEHCGCAWEKHRLTHGGRLSVAPEPAREDEDLALVA